jgi:hypothetical protein
MAFKASDFSPEILQQMINANVAPRKGLQFTSQEEGESHFRKYWEPVKEKLSFEHFATACVEDLNTNFIAKNEQPQRQWDNENPNTSHKQMQGKVTEEEIMKQFGNPFEEAVRPTTPPDSKPLTQYQNMPVQRASTKNQLFVPSREYNRRLDICRNCPNIEPVAGICNLCGCPMADKAAYSGSECADENNKRWLSFEEDPNAILL